MITNLFSAVNYGTLHKGLRFTVYLYTSLIDTLLGCFAFDIKVTLSTVLSAASKHALHLPSSEPDGPCAACSTLEVYWQVAILSSQPIKEPVSHTFKAISMTCYRQIATVVHSLLSQISFYCTVSCPTYYLYLWPSFRGGRSTCTLYLSSAVSSLVV